MPWWSRPPRSTSSGNAPVRCWRPASRQAPRRARGVDALTARGEAPPLLREHRLYQADWLLRFYGFAADEIAPQAGGMLSLDLDPKTAWALAHPERFPVDLDRAPREQLLRVPGLGVRAVTRLLMARRARRLRVADLTALRVPVRRVLPFVVLVDHRPAPGAAQRLAVAAVSRSKTALALAQPAQAALF